MKTGKTNDPAVTCSGKSSGGDGERLIWVYFVAEFTGLSD